MLTANIDLSTRRAVYRRDFFQCICCGATKYLQIHHVVPRSHGGGNDPTNLVTLCWHCHSLAHGDHFPDDPPYMCEQWVVEACADYLVDLYPDIYEPDNPAR
jgi:hypothetical protein